MTEEELIEITSPFNRNDCNDERCAKVKEWSGSVAVVQRTQTALAAVCREVRDDALELYYACNDFQAGYCCTKETCENVKLLEWQKRGLCLDVSAEAAFGSFECPSMEFSTEAQVKLLALGATIDAVNGKHVAHTVMFPKVKEDDQGGLRSFLLPD